MSTTVTPAPPSSGHGNHAIDYNTNTQNGKSVQIAITYQGSDLYFAICALMGFTALSIIAASALKPRTDRIFFYITAGVNMVACVAYFSMGSNLGWTPIDVEFARSSPKVAGINREIFYVRYIDWFITTPLLLMDLLLTAGMPWPTIIFTILMDEVMIVTGLIGALVKSQYKWGYYAFGCAAMFYVFWNLAWEGRLHAKRIADMTGEPKIYRTYLMCGVITLGLWLLYPVAWGLCEGGNVISPDSEAIFYGILDSCAKPGFSIALIVGHWTVSPSLMGLRIRDIDEDPILFSNNAEKKAYKPNGTTPVDGYTNGHSRAYASGNDAVVTA